MALEIGTLKPAARVLPSAGLFLLAPSLQNAVSKRDLHTDLLWRGHGGSKGDVVSEGPLNPETLMLLKFHRKMPMWERPLGHDAPTTDGPSEMPSPPRVRGS